MEPKVFAFEEFQLDCEGLELSRNGRGLKLERKPLELLILLVSRQGDLVTRAEIAERLWEPTVFVDTEHGINTAVRKIRRTLRDDPAQPRFVQTVPGKGYRFVATAVDLSPAPEIRPEIHHGISHDAPTAEVEAAIQPVSLTTLPVARQLRHRTVPRWVVFGSIAAALLLIVSAIALHFFRHNNLYTVAEMRPVTTYPGAALHPSYSPDGRFVTFSWDGEGERSIYVALPRSDHPLRLTHGASDDDFPMWSPDGRYIAFIRFSGAYEGQLMLISPLGGGEERVLRSVELRFATLSSSSYLAWTPDSKWLCFTTRSEKSKSRERLMLLSPDTGESRPVFSTADKNTSDSSPAFSPDGRWLAFARFSYPYNSTIVLQHLSAGLQPEGNPIAVRGTGANPLSPVWTQDSRSLLFLERLSSRLFQVEVSDVLSLRPAHQIYVASTRMEGLSFAGPEPRLCTSIFANGADLWQMRLKGGSGGARVSRKILESKASQYHPEYSPDGRSMSFVGDRDGSHQVWIATADGESPRQLTHLANHILGFPRWSPDSQSIAFHARAPVDAELYVIRVGDGVLRQVTHGAPGIMAPSWSDDGKFLYGFGSHNGTEFVFRITLATGKREALWEGTRAREVPGRHLLIYGKISPRGIFARSLTERGPAEPEQKLVDDFIDTGLGGFVPFTDGFYYSAMDTTGNFRAICFYSFDSKKTIDVAPVPPNLADGFAVSPDRSTLTYAAAKSDEADLISLELKRERN
jgi:Tol biopolymer transport system component/DNA-binding winged helix-turn-helix (wHTH) protein